MRIAKLLLASTLLAGSINVASAAQSYTQIQLDAFDFVYDAAIVSQSFTDIDHAGGMGNAERQAFGVYMRRLADAATDLIPLDFSVTGCDNFLDWEDFMNPIILKLNEESCELNQLHAKNGAGRPKANPTVVVTLGQAYAAVGKYLFWEGVQDFGITGLKEHFAEGFYNKLVAEGIVTNVLSDDFDEEMIRADMFVLFMFALEYVDEQTNNGGVTGSGGNNTGTGWNNTGTGGNNMGTGGNNAGTGGVTGSGNNTTGGNTGGGITTGNNMTGGNTGGPTGTGGNSGTGGNTGTGGNSTGGNNTSGGTSTGAMMSNFVYNPGVTPLYGPYANLLS